MRRIHGRIVVTGGAGFIGSHLVERLLQEAADEVIVFDDFSRGTLQNLQGCLEDARLEVVRGDIREMRAVNAALRGAQVVFHLAAQVDLPNTARSIDAMFSTNVVGTYNVLRAAQRQQIKRVIFSSSCDVYGQTVALPVDEIHPLLASTTYGASKTAGEAYCRAFRRLFGLPVVVLRLAAVYGPRGWNGEIPALIEQVTAGRALQLNGNGRQVGDYVWIGQVIEALIRAGVSDDALPPINVASGTGVSLADVARCIGHVLGRQGDFEVRSSGGQENTRFVARVDRMREVLGIEPPSDALAHLHTWLRSAVPSAV